jgi:hypothetical protein
MRATDEWMKLIEGNIAVLSDGEMKLIEGSIAVLTDGGDETN